MDSSQCDASEHTIKHRFLQNSSMTLNKFFQLAYYQISHEPGSDLRVRGDPDSSCASKDSCDSLEPVSQKSAHENRKKDRTRFPEKSLLADNSIA
ncbi:hypothetical protein CDAR_42661 [Caerostris darwini]|uniref:Uncharacterized protein n=1 Tax=Caerostris darwini TaxID=1538125 RepID=A0AAV4RSS0_9ARAC|nr:hypothetical protein CDAR_42661 [Caerostris darwini]